MTQAGFEQGHGIGTMIGKRYAKRAVTRNLIRRQIYAVFADPVLQALPKLEILVRLRSPIHTPAQTFTSASSDPLKMTIRQELQSILTTVQKQLSHPKSS